MKIAVVGAGVSGLSSAVELASIADVTVFHDLPLLESTSAIATAIWHLYLVDPGDRDVLHWGHRTLLRLCEMSGPQTGIELVRGVELFRNSPPHRPAWADSAIEFHILDDMELTQFPGISWGYRLAAPTANMSKYLPWLMAQCRSLGVTFLSRTLKSLDELQEFDYIINCAGLRARELTVDDELFGMRGQYLVLSPPTAAAIGGYIGDDEHPSGMAYMIPRDGEVLIGGTEEMSEEMVFDISEEELLLRAGTFCPEVVKGAVITRRVVGIRPCRRSGKVVLGKDSTDERIIHNYGHGGSGFSLSWGCAEAVLAEVLK